MGDQPTRDLALQPQQALQVDVAVKQVAMFFPRKGEAQSEAFFVQPANGPGNFGRGCAFNEIGARVSSQVFVQFFDWA